MAKIEAVRDALVSGDDAALTSATNGVPACKEPAPGAEQACLGAIAAALGSKSGFNGTSPDQASAAAVALVVARDRHGEWATAADVWLSAIRTGKGAGIDALRVAVARQMAASAPDVGKAIDDDKDTRPLLKAVAAAIPGACTTYASLGAGANEATLSLAAMPDHSACVQKDLGRKDGPGGTYGRGLLRAAEGAAAIWKDMATALRDGLGLTGGAARPVVDTKLAAIDEATRKLALKKVPRDDGWIKEMTDLHGDAGVPFDGKPAAKADAGATLRR